MTRYSIDKGEFIYDTLGNRLTWKMDNSDWYRTQNLASVPMFFFVT